MYSDLSHLTEREITKLIDRYYAGEPTKALVEEYNLKTKPNSLFRLFPPLVSGDLVCEYCQKPLIAKRKPRSDNNYSGSDYYCPSCGHKPYVGYCKCGNCQEKYRVELERKKLLIQHVYSEKPNQIDYRDLTFVDRVYLGAVCILMLDEDMLHIFSYSNRGSDINLAPSLRLVIQILKRLIHNNIIVVSSLSSIGAFAEDNFPFTYSVTDVDYELNLIYPENKERLLKLIMNPDCYDESFRDEANQIWMIIAIEECVEYLEYELMKAGFDFTAGEKTRNMFEELLNDFSVAQIYGIIWREVANTSKYYLEHRISRKHAANITIGGCRRYAENAKLENWKLNDFHRTKDVPQSEISAFLFNRVLKIGDLGFTMPPGQL